MAANGDKEIWLGSEEIQLLLEGGLYWNDIEPKVTVKKDFLKDSPRLESDSQQDNKHQDYIQLFDEECDGEVSSIPIGQNTRRMHAEITPEMNNPEITQEMNQEMNQEITPEIKDRQIDLSNLNEKSGRTFAPDAGVFEHEYQDLEFDKAESDVGTEERNALISMYGPEDIPEVNVSWVGELEGEASPFLSGYKLIILLTGVALLTFGFWYYFLYF